MNDVAALPPDPPAAPALESGEIRKRAVRGVASTFGAHLANQLLRFGFGVYLARRLRPDDFALVAIVTAATGLLDLLRDQGLPNVLIQSPDLDARRINAIFWLLLGLLALEMALLGLLAPAMALFYRRPELAGLTAALAIGSALSGLTTVPLALLKRHVRFDRLARLQIGALLAALPFTAAAAAAGWGAWALALYIVLPGLFLLPGAWFACGWRPSLRPDLSSIRALAAHGRRFLGVDLVTYWSQSADALLLGRLLSGPDLGLYQRAQGTRLQAVSLVASTMVSVTVSCLARLQDRPDLFWKTYRTGACGMSLLLAPPALMLALAPAECLVYVFGAQWLPAAPALPILAILFLLHPLIRIVHAALFSLGRPDRLFRWLLLAAVLGTIGLLAGRPWGLRGVAAGLVLGQAAALPVGLGSLARILKTRPITLLRPVLPVSLATLAVGAAAWPLTRLADPPGTTAWPRFATAGGAVVLLLTGLAAGLARSEAGRLVLATVRDTLTPRARRGPTPPEQAGEWPKA